jgi:hypothetical protein
MKETDLIQAKLTKLSAEQIRCELARIETGIARAQSPGAIKRYETRRRLYQDELAKRVSGIPKTQPK